jgi:cytidylate kinase
VYLDGADITHRLHTREVSNIVAEYAHLPCLRALVKSFQKSLAGTHSIICEGRDIGSVIFPNATFKFYLTASLAARARRRWQQEVAKGLDSKYRSVKRGIARRDHLDKTRAQSPLVRVKDAYVINNTKLQPEEAVAKMLKIIERETNRRAEFVQKDFRMPHGSSALRVFWKSTALWVFRVITFQHVINRKK